MNHARPKATNGKYLFICSNSIVFSCQWQELLPVFTASARCRRTEESQAVSQTVVTQLLRWRRVRPSNWPSSSASSTRQSSTPSISWLRSCTCAAPFCSKLSPHSCGCISFAVKTASAFLDRCCNRSDRQSVRVARPCRCKLWTAVDIFTQFQGQTLTRLTIRVHIDRLLRRISDSCNCFAYRLRI